MSRFEAYAMNGDELCHSNQTWRIHFRSVMTHCTLWDEKVPLRLCLLNEFSLFRKTDLPIDLHIVPSLLEVERVVEDGDSKLLPLETVSMETHGEPILRHESNSSSFGISFHQSPSFPSSSFEDENGDIIISIQFSIEDTEERRNSIPRLILPLVWRLCLKPKSALSFSSKNHNPPLSFDADTGIDLTGGTGRLPAKLMRRRVVTVSDMPSFAVVEHEDYDIAGKVWDGGLALVHYLHFIEGASSLRHSRILELGGGTGLVGLCCGVHGGHVVTTDMDGATHLLRYNSEINQRKISEAGGSCECRDFTWGEDISVLKPHRKSKEEGKEEEEEEPWFDLLVMSDVVYDPIAYQPLLDSLERLLVPNKNRALMGHRSRHPDEQQFFDAARKSLEVKKIDFSFKTLSFPCDDISLFEFTKK